jgi:hypothetical protein
LDRHRDTELQSNGIPAKGAEVAFRNGLGPRMLLSDRAPATDPLQQAGRCQAAGSGNGVNGALPGPGLERYHPLPSVLNRACSDGRR